MSERRKLYFPKWEGAIEGSVVNFLKRNLWRVSSTMEYDDALQEARFVFLTMKARHPVLDTPQHFMALYKTAWRNHFTDMSNKSTNDRTAISESQFISSDSEDSVSIISQIVGDTDNSGMLSIMVRQAPDEIKAVLSLFVSAPVELLDMVSASWKSKGKKKDHGNQMLCSMIGLPPGTDIVGRVREYFSK